MQSWDNFLEINCKDDDTAHGKLFQPMKQADHFHNNWKSEEAAISKFVSVRSGLYLWYWCPI